MKYLCTLILALFALQSFGQTLEADRLALVAFYNAGNGPNWHINTGWTSPGVPGDSPCGWYGVTCEGGRVTKLVLEDNGIGPTLPAAIGGLSALKHLDLSGAGEEFFNFRGDIPAELGNLTNLEYLDLSENMIFGPNIAVIGNLTNLKHLSITPYAAVPASFANLTNLEYLRLASDDYPMGSGAAVGVIPAFFGNFSKLKTLIMHAAGATGAIPYALSTLTNLEVLDLSQNQLIGTIPGVNNFTKLTKLDLSYNQLGEMIPDLSAIPIAANVNISNNNFTFSGMEANVAYLDIYAPQSDIEVMYSNGLPPTALYADGGGTPNEIYKWYFQDQLIFTGIGNGQLLISDDGLYKVEVTNPMVPGLTLKGELDVTILPVTLVSFNGKFENNQTKLTWKTTSETNNKGFEIERSADVKTFEKIGFVDGSGDTKEIQTYHFTDLQPFETSYYRLKQLDYDGKFEYSKVIAVRGDQVEIKVYPNPAQEYLTISGIETGTEVSIINQSGRVVLKSRINPKRAIAISGLSAGLYNVLAGGVSKKLLINR